MTMQVFEISSLEDLEGIIASIGPVGPRIGPGKRTKDKTEWDVILRFLRQAIPSGIFQLPIAIRRGLPPREPDFVVARGAAVDDDVIGLIEITEATNEADQRERTAFERSGKSAAMLGQFGGRFPRGAGGPPGLVWASDIIDAIKRKSGKVIFEGSQAARHLVIYPNSNASILLFSEEDEDGAIRKLREAIAAEAASLAQTTNGCLVHVLGKHSVCINVVAPSSEGRRIFKVPIAPQDGHWMWANGHNGDIRRAAYGYEPTREAAMAAFANGWRRKG